MRAGVAAAIEFNSSRLSKTVPRGTVRGTVRGIPILVRGEEIYVGAWVATPGFIKDQVNQLKTDANSLRDYVIGLINKKDHPKRAELEFYFKNSLLPFMSGVSEFVDRHQKWHDNMWGSTLDTINEWREALKAQWGAANKISSLDGLPEPKGAIEHGVIEKAMSSAGSAIRGIWDVVKFIIYGGLIIFGIIVLGRFVQIWKEPRFA